MHAPSVLLLAACASPVLAQKDATSPANPDTYLLHLHDALTKRWPKNRTINIVCHGHSVPAGYFRTPVVDTFNAYPHLLHVALKRRYPHAVLNVINTAIGGEESHRGSQRFSRDVLDKRPDLITIDYALNDRRIGLERSRQSITAMLRAAAKRKIPVLLLTPTADRRAKLNDPKDPLCQHAAQIHALAGEFGVGLVDSFAAYRRALANGTKLGQLMSQSNHPNRRGHDLVVQELLKWFPQPNTKNDPDQSPAASVLLVEDIVHKDGVIGTRQLVRIRIGDGSIGEKRVLLTKEQRFFGHFGGHRLVENRYVVTKDGSVIDGRDGSIVARKRRNAVLAKLPNRPTGHIYAADGKRFVRVSANGELWLEGEGESVKLGEGFAYQLSRLASGMAIGAPVAWLDEATVLTQRENGKLLAVQLDGTVAPFVTITGTKAPVLAPTLEWEPDGRLIYTCENAFVIDTKKRTAKPSPWRALGHGFHVERELPKKRGRAIRYRGRHIGEFVCLPYLARTAPGRIAIPCAKRGQLGYPRRLRVWDAKSRHWSHLDLRINSFVGWLR